jgi:uncharacterized protein YhhL (DUF1145 family)
VTPLLTLFVCWLALAALATALWPRHPYWAITAWVALFGCLCAAYASEPGWFPTVLGIPLWIHIVRSLDAANSNPGLSRGQYLLYLVDLSRVPPGEESEPPPAGAAAKRMARGLLLAGCGGGLYVLGAHLEVWREHPYLDDLLILVEAGVFFTAITDVVAGAWGLLKIPAPNPHDPTFFLARSLRDFWGNRWNRCFSGSLRRAAFDPVRRGRQRRALAVFLTFVLSGLVHGPALALASADRRAAFLLAVAGTGFFLVHGLAVLLESSLPRRLRRSTGRLTLFGVFALTAPLYPATGTASFGWHGRPFEQATVLQLAELW